jgi:Ca2+-binding RTX toxin-like protein
VNVERFFEDADGNLVLGGENNGTDRVGVSYNATTGLVTLSHSVNGVTTRFVARPDSSDTVIKVFGQGQNDDIRVSGSFPFAVEFSGGPGNDYLAGGPLDDVLDGGANNDIIIGGAGNDSLLGQAGSDKMDGGAGDDWMDGGADNDSMTGNTGNDTMLGGAGVDSVNGVAGNDLLDGGDGNDALDGGLGDDIVFGGLGNDRVLGNAGRDLLLGGAGLDALNGGNDDDILVADVVAGADVGDPYANFEAIHDGWLLPGSYNARVDNMIASLLDSSMVSGDGSKETLVGGSGLDWFLFDPAASIATLDKITKQIGERVNEF